MATVAQAQHLLEKPGEARAAAGQADSDGVASALVLQVWTLDAAPSTSQNSGSACAFIEIEAM
jgi:hypothetical protein